MTLNTEPKNRYQALVLALGLALTAPDDVSMNRCIELAETLTQGMALEEVNRAKCNAWYAADCPPVDGREDPK